MSQQRYLRKFVGHPRTKQGLTSEGDDAYIQGFPRWPRGEVREVTEDMARFLDAANSKQFTVFATVPDPAIETARLKAEADAKAEAERALLQSLKPTKSAARAAAKETK